MPRENSSGVKEVAEFNINKEVFDKNFEDIFGKKERKFRRLLVHHESDSLFEEYLTDTELEKFSECDEVTGVEIWEDRYREEQNVKL